MEHVGPFVHGVALLLLWRPLLELVQPRGWLAEAEARIPRQKKDEEEGRGMLHEPNRG